MSSYSHQEYKLALQTISKAAGKTFWLTTTEEGVKEWGYDDESTPPTQSEIETQIPSAVTAYNWEDVRRKRDNKLYGCDWTQSSDSPLTDAKKTEWATYRQALRNITNQSDPLNITWPTEPS
tara:strand:- start:68 stop:433 length:366 start_codon:yes stop_codon:yes gene_type:complete